MFLPTWFLWEAEQILQFTGSGKSPWQIRSQETDLSWGLSARQVRGKPLLPLNPTRPMRWACPWLGFLRKWQLSQGWGRKLRASWGEQQRKVENWNCYMIPAHSLPLPASNFPSLKNWEERVSASPWTGSWSEAAAPVHPAGMGPADLQAGNRRVFEGRTVGPDGLIESLSVALAVHTPVSSFHLSAWVSHFPKLERLCLPHKMVMRTDWICLKGQAHHSRPINGS